MVSMLHLVITKIDSIVIGIKTNLGLVTYHCMKDVVLLDTSQYGTQCRLIKQTWNILGT